MAGAPLPSLDQGTSISTPAASPQSGQLRFIIDVTLRHWVLMSVLIGLGAFTGGVIGVMLQDDRYSWEASTELLFPPSRWDQPALRGLGVDVFGAATPASLIDRTSMQSLSEDVARAIVQEDIADNGPWSYVTTEEDYDAKAEEIRATLYLDDRTGEGILGVRAQSNNPEDAERIAEYAARVLIDYNRRLIVDEQLETSEFVSQQLEELRTQLDNAESEMWAFRESMGFQTHDQLREEMEQKNAELLSVQTEKEQIKAQIAEVGASLERNLTELPDALGSVTDNVISELHKDLDALRQRQLELSIIWQPEYPELVAIEEEITEKKQAILQAISELDAGSTAGGSLWQQRQELYRKRLDFELQLTGLDIRAGILNSLLADMIDRLPELADKSFQYEQIAHEAEQIRQQFNMMLEKEFEIKTARNRSASAIERKDAVAVATFPMGRNSPLWASVMLGAIIGFIIAFGVSMMWEMMDTSIRSIEDAQEFLALDVIGMIPMMKFGKVKQGRRRRGAYVVATDEDQIDACIVTQHDPKSPISEAYRSLRTNFQFATIKHQPKSVMITSAVPGEGKTTTAVNFAVTMADRGMKVLIVDTDLRRPNVHRVLKMERGPGLADVLRERIPVKSVIRSTRVENLSIISSGRVPPNPSELIGSERMRKLMEELGGSFDLVICDAPSILVVTDPVLLATHVDTVTIVVSVGFARRETIMRAKKLMETANPFISGVILNGLEATRRHYYYYYYYYDDRAAPARRRWYHNI